METTFAGDVRVVLAHLDAGDVYVDDEIEVMPKIGIGEMEHVVI